jgi:hypothetical protein
MVSQKGGCFLRAMYTDQVGRLYERVAVGTVQRECHLSATAFQVVADLAGSPPRRLLQSLPDKRLNAVPPRHADAG